MPLNGIFAGCLIYIPIVRFAIQKGSVIFYRCVTRNKIPTVAEQTGNCDHA